ncbi:MAG: hypothetical protein D6770_10965 [Anaerolineae bacterium]|nr:MAG: hypothetical protein D6770_10965 [Anaerolineae bacterium]
MATTEERLKILQMIEEGKISAEEGAELLSALGEERRKSTFPSSRASQRTLRVHVTDVRSGTSKVSVRIPLTLLEAGLKIGAHFAPEIGDVDLNALMESLRSGLEGKIIDVVDEEDGEHVEIYVD